MEQSIISSRTSFVWLAYQATDTEIHMEKDKNWNIHITALDVATAIGGLIVDYASKLSNLPSTPLSTRSEHSGGAERMLSEVMDSEGEAYEQGQLFSSHMYERFTRAG